jgi:hypothetical protein
MFHAETEAIVLMTVHSFFATALVTIPEEHVNVRILMIS